MLGELISRKKQLFLAHIYATNLQNVCDISIKMNEIKIEQKNSPLTNKDITYSNNFIHKIQFGSIAVEKSLQPAFNQSIVFNYSIKCFIAYRN